MAKSGAYDVTNAIIGLFCGHEDSLNKSSLVLICIEHGEQIRIIKKLETISQRYFAISQK